MKQGKASSANLQQPSNPLWDSYSKILENKNFDPYVNSAGWFPEEKKTLSVYNLTLFHISTR
jgi:hypothetical protein